MDSFTQIVLGAAVCRRHRTAGHRRAALLAGAALGTLPDLDVLPINLITDDPVARMTWHRSFSHSLLVLPFVAWVLWAWFRSRGKRVAQSPVRWFWAMQAALLTHPLLDAFTVYGTQLLWPLPMRPVMWSSVFIIDPLYTVWLLVACVVAWFARERRIAQPALVAGLALSSLYLGSRCSPSTRSNVRRSSRWPRGTCENAPRFSVPMPFNILLWRVVAMTPDGFVEGDRSLVADRGPMVFREYRSDVAALAQVSAYPAVRSLEWFNRGFMKAQVRDEPTGAVGPAHGRGARLQLPLRRRREDRRRLARDSADQLQWPWEAGRRLGAMWQRIWHAPEVDGRDGHTHAASFREGGSEGLIGESSQGKDHASAGAAWRAHAALQTDVDLFTVAPCRRRDMIDSGRLPPRVAAIRRRGRTYSALRSSSSLRSICTMYSWPCVSRSATASPFIRRS